MNKWSKSERILKRMEDERSASSTRARLSKQNLENKEFKRGLKNRLALAMVFGLVFLLVAPLVVEALSVDDMLKKVGVKNPGKWTTIGTNILVLLGVVVILAPFITASMGGEGKDMTQKYMVTAGMGVVAIVIAFLMYESYKGQKIWQIWFVANMLSMKPIVNLGLAFGILYMLYSLLIKEAIEGKEKEKADPTVKWIAFFLILFISYTIIDMPKNGQKLSPNYEYLWEQKKMEGYRNFLIGDKNSPCVAETGKKNCYYQKIKGAIAKDPDGKPVVRYGVLVGQNIIFLFIGFAIFYWLFDTIGIVKDKKDEVVGAGQINKVLTLIASASIANTKADVGAFVGLMEVIVFLILMIVLEVKKDFVGGEGHSSGMWDRLTGIAKALGSAWVISLITGAFGIKDTYSAKLFTFLGGAAVVIGAIIIGLVSFGIMSMSKGDMKKWRLIGSIGLGVSFILWTMVG